MWVTVIFKCRGKCKTILTAERIQEMNEIVAELTKIDLWPKFCVHLKNEEIVDKYGCTESSYLNFTKIMGSQLDTPENVTEAQMQDIYEKVAKAVIQEPRARQTLDKHYSE